MSSDSNSIPYRTLVAAADRLFRECEDDVDLLSDKLEALDPDLRSELLVSDLLNAYQAFYYFFRTVPDELVKERMELEPASELIRGIKIDEPDLLEMYFFVKNRGPVIVITDGDRALATFSGRNAYANGLKYLENPEYST
jgi:hypothetical protein